MRFPVCLRLIALCAVLAFTPVAPPSLAQPITSDALSFDSPTADPEVLQNAFDLFSPDRERRLAAIWYFELRDDPDAIPALIFALRFTSGEWLELSEALAALAGESAGDTWRQWMLWQERRPDITPFDGFAGFKAAVYSRIDPNFTVFLSDGVAHDIRLEEIVWGGVVKDGIPALTNPTLIPADAAAYLTPDEPVFGVEINGDARAYPLRILDWHEMFNDVIGGVPVSLAYCTLCGSGILFETAAQGRETPFVFGSSGFLYRSNKLMYDQSTHSLWNQFTGRPVVGPLTGSGITLNTRPVVIASWADWRARHPDTRVLSPETGHDRDYRPGAPYGDYFASPNLMFPTNVDETTLAAKDYVFALRGGAADVAWPLSRFAETPVINDVAGAVPVTLIGDAETRSVRAYRTNGEAFSPGAEPDTVRLGEAVWRVTEVALEGPNGEQLTRLPGHIAYWFAWNGYLGNEGRLAVD